MKLLPSFPERDITLRDNGVLKRHHSPADILAAEVPIVRSNPTNPIVRSSLHERNGTLYLPNPGSLPIDRCIKTNLPAATIVMVNLRNPFDPLTWLNKNQRSIMVGLSAAAHARYREIIAISRISLLGAIATFIRGVLWGPIFFVATLGLTIASNLLKTSQPVRLSEICEEGIMIKGVCSAYLRDVTLQNSHSGI